MGDSERMPNNFSWIIEDEIAGMGWPNTKEHLQYLLNVGIRYLVTLASDKRPPISSCPLIRSTTIEVREFFAPTISQINQFIRVCEEARRNKLAIGVHCWQGHGRTGVMLSCYLVKFYGMAPEMAIDRVRKLRPRSVETYDQERIVIEYNDYLCSTF